MEPRLVTDVEALLAGAPRGLADLLAPLERGDWPVVRTEVSEEALALVLEASAALADDQQATAEPLGDALAWDVAWHARDWVLRGHVRPELSERWSSALDPTSPVVLLRRRPATIVAGERVLPLAAQALGLGLVDRWVRGVRDRLGDDA